MVNIANMSAEEIVKKVESGEIPSCTYRTFAEYMKAMVEK